MTLHKLSDGNDVREHLQKFFETTDELSEMGVDINPDLLSVMLLYSLPPSFENFRCAIESRDELPSPETLRIKITEENDARRNETRVSSDALLVQKYTGQSRFDKGRNTYQRNYGDSGTRRYGAFKKNGGAVNTFQRSYENSESGRFKYKCHRCRNVGHKAIQCPNVAKKNKRANNTEDILALNAITEINTYGINNNEEFGWCLDSGCNSHLCKNARNFVEFSEVATGKLNLANNTSTKI